MTPEHPSNIAAGVSTCKSSDIIFVSTATKEPIGVIESVESASCHTGSPNQIMYDRRSLCIHLDDKPLPALPDVKDDDVVLHGGNYADSFITVSTESQSQKALDDPLSSMRASEHENWDEKSTSIDIPVPILVSSTEPRDTPLSANDEKTDAPSITQTTKPALAQRLPPLSPPSQPSKADNVVVPELLPLPVTTPSAGRRAFDSVRGVFQWTECPPPNESFTISTAKTLPAFDQASIATSASITSLQAATERVTEYVAVTAHTTVEYLSAAIPSTVDFATRSANTTAQYLSNQLPFPRLFNGSVADQGPASASSRDPLHDVVEDAAQRKRRIRREQRRLSRAYSNIHLGTLQSNDHERGHSHINQRSQSAPMLVQPRNGQSNGGGTRGGTRGHAAQGLQPPPAAFLGSRRSHTDTIASSAASSVASSVLDSMGDGYSTIPSTRSILPKHKRKRAPRRLLQTIPGPEGLDPQVRRELEAQGFAALRFRDGTAGRSWRNWWDPRRYGLPRYILFDEFRQPRMCTVVLLVAVVTIITLPISLKNRD